MAKYDGQIVELKTLLPNAKNVLIALPTNSDIDKLAAGLAMFLALEQSGKQVSVVSSDTIKVSQAHLFGIDHIQKNIPATEGGNLMITLEGVATDEGTVPALQNLDWYPENNNLNLVFHTLPGQTFQPSKIVPHYSGSGFNLIITLGAPSLNALGNVYTQNPQAFSGVHTVNIDNQPNNTSFGQTNVLDQNSASISEIMADLIPSLGLPLDGDEASNLLAGIYDATNNLTSPRVNADTFMIVANLMKSGGKKTEGNNVAPSQGLDLSGLMPKAPESQPIPVQSQPQVTQPVAETAPQTQEFTVPPVVNPTSVEPVQPQQSPEEGPQMENMTTENIEVEPGWLTPKVFKGSSVG